MAVIARSFPWARQPDGPAQLSPVWLQKGLITAISAGYQASYNEVSSFRGEKLANATVNARGTRLTSDGFNEKQDWLNVPLTSGRPFTLEAMVIWNGGNSNGLRDVCMAAGNARFWSSGGTNNRGISLGLGYDTFRPGTDWSMDGTPQHLVVSVQIPTLTWYMNGKQIAVTGQYGSASSPTALTPSIGAVGQRAALVTVPKLAYYLGVLSAHDVASLYQNPWQIFA